MAEGGAQRRTPWEHFPAATESARAARVFVHDALVGWGLPHLVDDAVAIVSELVTNAVTHARSPADVRVTQWPASVEVSVRDLRAEPPVPRRFHGHADLGGRGLMIVEQLAARWGVEVLSAGGKAVWAEIARSPVGTQPGR